VFSIRLDANFKFGIGSSGGTSALIGACAVRDTVDLSRALLAAYKNQDTAWQTIINIFPVSLSLLTTVRTIVSEYQALVKPYAAATLAGSSVAHSVHINGHLFGIAAYTLYLGGLSMWKFIHDSWRGSVGGRPPIRLRYILRRVSWENRGEPYTL